MAIAASHNATGVILYSDPSDSAVEGMDNVYPKSWWLPPTGVQRGNVRMASGDPLTPGYPSTGNHCNFKKNYSTCVCFICGRLQGETLNYEKFYICIHFTWSELS